MANQAPAAPLDTQPIVQGVLDAVVERDREREIITRRYGLFDRRETLEQIGELLGITRERVRQLEKAVLTRLKNTAEKDLVHIKDVEQVLNSHLSDMGKVARVSQVTGRIVPANGRTDQA